MGLTARLFSLVSLVQKRQVVTGFPNGTAKDIQDTIAFARDHGVRCMIEKFPLHRAQEAYDRLDGARFRAVIVP